MYFLLDFFIFYEINIPRKVYSIQFSTDTCTLLMLSVVVL